MSGAAFEIVMVPIGSYLHHPPLDNIDLEADRIVDLLSQIGGVAPNHPAAQQRLDEPAVKERLRRWVARTTAPSGVLVWLGHGASDGVDAWLATFETPDPISGNGIVPKTVADQINEDWRHRGEDDKAWSLVVIEACGAGKFVNSLIHLVLDNDPLRLTLIGLGGDGAEYLGRFGDVLRDTIGTYTVNDEIMQLDDFLDQLKRRLAPEDKFFPFPGGSGLVLPPRRLIDTQVTAPVDVYSDLVELLERLPTDERSHFIPKAQGAEHGELTWYFEGRSDERRKISSWLRHNTSGMLIVTGRAGAGKSALLGNVYEYSRPELREVLIRGGHLERVTDDERPPDNAFDVVVHLTGITTSELVRRLADAADAVLPVGELAESGQDLESLLASLGDRSFTVLADALDEAQEPATIASTVLRRLAALPATRVIVGTRMSTREGPDQPYTADEDLLVALGRANIKTETLYVSRAPAAIATYLERRLQATREAARHQLSDAAIKEVVTLVGNREREFLFARLAVHEIIARPELLAPGHRKELVTLLSGDHRTLFAAAVARLTAESRTARPLLEALALARGRGVPRVGRIWALIAGALTPDTDIRERDIDHVHDAAAPYIMLDGGDGQSVYRLAHRTFQEFFASPRLADAGEPLALEDRHRRVARTLIADVRESRVVNPYVAHRLAEHVSEGGLWDELAGAPLVLDHLDPESVAAEALRTAYGRADLPLAIAASLSARHLLSVIGPDDRAMTRSIAMACIQSGDVPPVFGYQPAPAWALLERRDPLHVRLAGPDAAVRAVCPLGLPDSRILLATSGDDARLRLWDPSTGRPVGDPFTGTHARVLSLAVLDSGDGRTLVAIGDSDGNLVLWDPYNAKPVTEPLRAHSSAVLAAAAFSRGDRGSTLITCGLDGMAMWRIAGSAPIDRHFLAPGYRARALTWLSLSGRNLIVTGGYDAVVRLWDPMTGQQVSQALGPSGGAINAVEAVTLPDGRVLVAAGGEDATIRLWDPVTGRPASQPLTGHHRAVHALTAVPLSGGRVLLASGGEDATIRLWDPVTGRPASQPLTGHHRAVHALTAVPLSDGRVLLASGGEDATIRLWDPSPAGRTNVRPAPYPGRMLALTTVPMPDGSVLIATGNDRGVVQMLDPQTGTPVGAAMRGETGAIHAMVSLMLPDNRTVLAVSGATGSVTCWNPVTGRPFGRAMTGHTGAVLTMAVVPLDARQVVLASAGHDDKIRLWNPVTGGLFGLLHLRSGHRRVVRALAVAQITGSSALIASVGDDPEVLLWDPYSSAPTRRITISSATTLSAVAILSLPDGRITLTVGSRDGSVYLWDVSAQRLVELAPPGPAVLAMATLTIPSQRQLLAVASADGGVRLWDVAESRVLRTILLPFDQSAKKLIAVGPRPVRLAMCTDLGLIGCELDADLSGLPRPVAR